MPENIPPQGIPRDIPRDLKPYFLCFLLKGVHWDSPVGAEALMPAQLAFLRAQIEAGTYKLAGPVGGGGPIVGFSILEAPSAEAALVLARQDPAVQSGRITAQVLPVILPNIDAIKVSFGPV